MTHAAAARLAFVFSVLVATMLALPSPASAAGRYIVVLQEGASTSAAAARHGARPDRTYAHALRGYAATLSGAALARAHRDPAVRFVSEDRTVSTAGKPRSGSGSPAQRVPTGILRTGQPASRYDGSAEGGALADVAVLDTGIDPKHADLDVVGGRNCSTGKSYADGHGHGTHVAGTIGAHDDAIGVVGVSPGARLHAVRVLDNNGSGSWSSVICGLDWVHANAGVIEVANMSLSGSGRDGGGCGLPTGDALHAAICRVTDAGVTVVVAAGNDARDASGATPASYDEVVTVSAWADFDGAPGGAFVGSGCRADQDDSFASFSNYGADVDIAAPGVCILSTWKGGSYETISGTSMSSPHVAGAAALYRAAHPQATPAEVRDALLAGRSFPTVADDPDGTWEGLLSLAAS